jgi:hypothetical protein
MYYRDESKKPTERGHYSSAAVLGSAGECAVIVAFESARVAACNRDRPQLPVHDEEKVLESAVGAARAAMGTFAAGPTDRALEDCRDLARAVYRDAGKAWREKVAQEDDPAAPAAEPVRRANPIADAVALGLPLAKRVVVFALALAGLLAPGAASAGDEDAGVRRNVGDACKTSDGKPGMWDWKDPVSAPGYWSCVPPWKEGDSCTRERMVWPDGRPAPGTWRLRNQEGGWLDPGPNGGHVRTIVYREKYWTCEPPDGHGLLCAGATKACVVVRDEGSK